MRQIKLLLISAVLAFSLLNLSPVASAAQGLVSKPGEYSGYSPMLYTEWARNSQYVEMRDGTKLAVDILRPAQDGVAVNTPHPVLWIYNWGGRALNNNHFVDRYAELAKYGYVVAMVDARGTGASYGTMINSYSRIEARDTYDLTEWFGTQPFSNGNVGMFGCSHSGQIEWLAAGMKPPHLKAIFPQCFSFDYYFGKVQGGIPSAFRATNWYDRDKTSVPVDEDPTGTMRNNAAEQHKNNQSDLAVFSVLPFRDSFSSITNSKPWLEASPGTYLKDIQDFGVPTYQWGNFNDFMTKVMREVFIFRANVDSVYKTGLGPGGHCQFGDFNMLAEERRWFDYWLKGIDNGIMKEPPLYFNTQAADAGKTWRFSWRWPLPNEKRVTYYLAHGPSGSGNAGVNDGILSLTRPSVDSAQDNYAADYTIISATRDTKGLTYTTQTVASDVELIGYVKANIWVSSTATDGDFFAFLEDLDAAGIPTVVTQLQLRASHRALNEPPFNNLGLPWRANLEADAAPLIPGQPVELVFDPLPISYLIKEGHCIRLTITNAYPSFGFLNPPATVSIYRNAAYASYISLPITTDPIRLGVQVKPETIDLKSNGELTVFITPPQGLGKGYRAEDIDIGSLTCNGAPVVSGRMENNTLIVKFNRKDLANTSAGPAVTLNLTGKFYYDIPFIGSGTVRVIGT